MKERFKKIMKEKNLTQMQMANIIGIDTSTVSCFCNGKRLPGFEILSKISQAFPDIDMNWFISGEERNEATDSSLEKDKKDSQILLNFPETDTPTKNNNPVPPSCSNKACKRVKRVIVLFDDGTMESYD